MAVLYYLWGWPASQYPRGMWWQQYCWFWWLFLCLYCWSGMDLPRDSIFMWNHSQYHCYPLESLYSQLEYSYEYNYFWVYYRSSCFSAGATWYRLDQFFVNSQWIATFPKSVPNYLQQWHSITLLLHFRGPPKPIPNLRNKLFISKFNFISFQQYFDQHYTSNCQLQPTSTGRMPHWLRHQHNLSLLWLNMWRWTSIYFTLRWWKPHWWRWLQLLLSNIKWIYLCQRHYHHSQCLQL